MELVERFKTVAQNSVLYSTVVGYDDKHPQLSQSEARLIETIPILTARQLIKLISISQRLFYFEDDIRLVTKSRVPKGDSRV